ncbi:MAG: hypothetical protein ACRC2T_17410, partial [Thermoguttaceae bacterium]
MTINRIKVLSLLLTLFAFLAVSQMASSAEGKIRTVDNARNWTKSAVPSKPVAQKRSTVATNVAYAAKKEDGKKIRVLFFHGGHGFDEPEMYEMLDSFTDITYDKAEMPKDANLIKPGLEKDYDCLVMYDFYTFPYTKEQIENFKELLNTGIGLVVMHH